MMENRKKDEPLDELSDRDRKFATDIAVAVTILATRLPSCGQSLFDYVTAEFTSCHNLPRAIARSALRHLGKALYEQDWELVVNKQGPALTSEFRVKPMEASNGTSRS